MVYGCGFWVELVGMLLCGWCFCVTVLFTVALRGRRGNLERKMKGLRTTSPCTAEGPWPHPVLAPAAP